MAQPFAPRDALRSLLRTSRRSSRIWLSLPLLFVTACGGSTLADSQWGSTGFPDRLLPPPPWYIEWATEQAKLQPDPKQTAVVRAARLIWEARSAGDSVDELIAASDEATLAQAGEMVTDAIGYNELMRRAEQVGWVEWVPVEQAQSAVDKRFIADVSPSTKAIEEAFKLVMTKAAPAALTTARVPVIGDKLALGILATALLAAGGIAVYEIVTAEDTSVATTSAPAPASAVQPHATTAPPTVEPRKYPNQTCENDEMARLEADMHTICDGAYAAKCSGNSRKEKEMLAQIPCSAIKLSIQQRQACLAARWVVQDKCFGGKPDDVHKKPIDDHQRGLDNCEALKLKNCAKGHPMAEK